MCLLNVLPNFFFFNDTATTEIYTLSLHDALPIYSIPLEVGSVVASATFGLRCKGMSARHFVHRMLRSEEHTSELQSQSNLVCRLLLEKKKVLAYMNYFKTALGSAIVVTVLRRAER